MASGLLSPTPVEKVGAEVDAEVEVPRRSVTNSKLRASVARQKGVRNGLVVHDAD